MRNFTYVSRDYVPSVDLATLGKTFDTLEQGHKEAVKAASELRTTIANLPMNEAEDGFKEQMANEVEELVDENTIYGNSYAALDDLIMKTGDIASDGRVIGRLRSQEAKKQYDEEVDAAAIPDAMKQMYKEENPYYYEDGAVDPRTGRVMPGKKWEPTTRPVKTVPMSEIQKHALSIAAKESGSGEVVTFLDAEGRETTDPTKSLDGAMYKKVGTRYEILSKDKIDKAMRIAIQSIPGAANSLAQDYKYASWEYGKLVDKARQEGGNVAPYVEGYTDKDGNVYTQEQWLTNAINGFKDVAAYKHINQDISFGTALENRRKMEAAAQAAAQGSGGQAESQGGQGSQGNGAFGTFTAGIEEVESSNFAQVQSVRTSANKQGFDIIKNIPGIPDNIKNAKSLGDIQNQLIKDVDYVKGPNTAAMYMINHYGADLNPEDKSKLINAFMSYWESNKQANEMIKKAGGDADALKFGANVANGTFTNDNKYGAEMIAALNDYYKYNDAARFRVGSEVLDAVCGLYGTNIEGLKALGIDIAKYDDESFDVTIDSKHGNLLPKFAATLNDANNQTPGTVGGWLENTFTRGVDKTNYFEYGSLGPLNLKATTLKPNFMQTFFTPYMNLNPAAYIDTYPSAGIVKLYNKGLEKASKAEESTGAIKGQLTFEGFDAQTTDEMFYREQLNMGSITRTEYEGYVKTSRENFRSVVANTALDIGDIRLVDDNNRVYKDVSRNVEIKNLLSKVTTSESWNNNVVVNVVTPIESIDSGKTAYKVTINVPKGAESEHYKAGDHVSFIIRGAITEGQGYVPALNPDIRAAKLLGVSRATGGNIDNIGYDNDLGDTRLIRNQDGTFRTTMFGHSVNIGEDDAASIIANINRLGQIRMRLQSGMYNNSELLKNSLVAISEKLSENTGADLDTIETCVVSFMKRKITD